MIGSTINSAPGVKAEDPGVGLGAGSIISRVSSSGFVVAVFVGLDSCLVTFFLGGK
jgi:hypothetical protein